MQRLVGGRQGDDWAGARVSQVAEASAGCHIPEELEHNVLALVGEHEPATATSSELRAMPVEQSCQKSVKVILHHGA